MKKIIISMAVMAMFAVMPASAQGIAFGVKGGVNFTKMSIDNDAVDCEAQVQHRTGFCHLVLLINQENRQPSLSTTTKTNGPYEKDDE